MNGWDLSVYIAAAILILAPVGVFFSYAGEIIRRIRENDWH